jgi:hypothetical protein
MTQSADLLGGFTPYQLYERAVSDAIRNSLLFGGLIAGTVLWAPTLLARIVVGVFVLLAMADLLSAIGGIVATPTMARLQPVGKERGFIVGATIVRTAGSLVLLLLVLWACRTVF